MNLKKIFINIGTWVSAKFNSIGAWLKNIFNNQSNSRNSHTGNSGSGELIPIGSQENLNADHQLFNYEYPHHNMDALNNHLKHVNDNRQLNDNRQRTNVDIERTKFIIILPTTPEEQISLDNVSFDDFCTELLKKLPSTINSTSIATLTQMIQQHCHQDGFLNMGESEIYTHIVKGYNKNNELPTKLTKFTRDPFTIDLSNINNNRILLTEAFTLLTIKDTDTGTDQQINAAFSLKSTLNLADRKLAINSFTVTMNKSSQNDAWFKLTNYGAKHNYTLRGLLNFFSHKHTAAPTTNPLTPQPTTTPVINNHNDASSSNTTGP